MDRAEEFYKQAIDANPKNARSLGSYAIFLSDDRKDLNRAEEFFKRAIDADPKDALLLGSYAHFLKDDRKDLDRAEEFYKRAIDADPKDADWLGHFAIILCEDRKDLDRAEEFYKRAIDADPKDAHALGSYAIFLSDDRKDLNRAEEFFKRAIDADPKDSHWLGIFANFLCEDRKDLDRADEFYKSAIDADPKDVDNHFNYGALLLSRGMTERGLTLIKEALVSRGESADDAFVVGAAFQFFVHGPSVERGERLSELKRLIDEGVRATGWSFDLNLARAIEERHSAKSWLKNLRPSLQMTPTQRLSRIGKPGNKCALNQTRLNRSGRPLVGIGGLKRGQVDTRRYMAPSPLWFPRNC